jgi:hypothetical protein
VVQKSTGSSQSENLGMAWRPYWEKAAVSKIWGFILINGKIPEQCLGGTSTHPRGLALTQPDRVDLCVPM